MNTLSWATSVLRNAIDQIFAPPPTFSPSSDIPDLSDKVVLVTGGNTGIGFEICLATLRKGAKIYLACRSSSKAQDAISDLHRLCPDRSSDITHLSLDLSDLGSVQTAAKQFLALEERLDILFCNAGVMVPPKTEVTKQGWDMQFGVNVLGHHRLVQLLEPALTNPNPNHKKEKSRLIFLSSIGHTLFPPSFSRAFHPELTRPGVARDGDEYGSWASWLGLGGGGVGKWGLYGHSKMGNILSSIHFHEQLGDKVVVSSCHPGLISTELYRTTPSLLTLPIKPLYKPPSYGALTPLYLGCHPDAADCGGKYLVPWVREVPGSLDPRARGEEGKRMAEVMDRWVGECVDKWEAEVREG